MVCWRSRAHRDLDESCKVCLDSKSSQVLVAEWHKSYKIFWGCRPTRRSVETSASLCKVSSDSKADKDSVEAWG